MRYVFDKNRREVVPAHERIDAPATSRGPHIAPDYPGYRSRVSGKWVEGRTAHREDLKATGCRLMEPGEEPAFLREQHG